MHELDELGQRWIPAELSERSAENLRLIECLRYISGIAKRGTGREQGANESVEQFILGYVKELEAERDRYRNLLFEALNDCEGQGWQVSAERDYFKWQYEIAQGAIRSLMKTVDAFKQNKT
jgi:hypothetical protein